MRSYPEQYGTYKLHYPCFNCRKCFKPHDSLLRQDVIRCPQCGDMLRAYSFYFKVPPRNDIQAWKALQMASKRQFIWRWGQDDRNLPRMIQRNQYDPNIYAGIDEAINALSSSHPAERNRAKEALLEIGRPALFPIIEILQNVGAPYPPPSELLIQILGDYGDGLASPVLVQALETGPDNIRLAAVIALGKVGYLSVVATNAIVDCFRKPAKDKEIARLLPIAAKKTLSLNNVSVNRLLPFLTDESSAVRAGVVEALSNTHPRNMPKDILTTLTPLLDDASPDVRREAEFGIRRLKNHGFDV